MYCIPAIRSPQKLIFLPTGPRLNPALSLLLAAVILCVASSEMGATYLFPSRWNMVKLDTTQNSCLELDLLHWGSGPIMKILKKMGCEMILQKDSLFPFPVSNGKRTWKTDSAKSWLPQAILSKFPLVDMSLCSRRNASMSGIMSPNAFGPCQHFSWNLVSGWATPQKRGTKYQWKTTNHRNKPVVSAVLLDTSYNLYPRIFPIVWLALIF